MVAAIAGHDSAHLSHLQCKRCFLKTLLHRTPSKSSQIPIGPEGTAVTSLLSIARERFKPLWLYFMHIACDFLHCERRCKRNLLPSTAWDWVSRFSMLDKKVRCSYLWHLHDTWCSSLLMKGVESSYNTNDNTTILCTATLPRSKVVAFGLPVTGTGTGTTTVNTFACWWQAKRASKTHPPPRALSWMS